MFDSVFSRQLKNAWKIGLGVDTDNAACSQRVYAPACGKPAGIPRLAVFVFAGTFLMMLLLHIVDGQLDEALPLTSLRTCWPSTYRMEMSPSVR